LDGYWVPRAPEVVAYMVNTILRTLLMETSVCLRESWRICSSRRFSFSSRVNDMRKKCTKYVTGNSA